MTVLHILYQVGRMDHNNSVGEGVENCMKELSRKDADASVTRRHMIAAAKDNPTASTTGRASVNTAARVTAPIEPSEQAYLVVHYMLPVRGGV